MFIQHLRNKLRDFRKDTSGSVAAEAVVIFPVMLSCLFVMMVIFDAYRARTTTEKAAFTISDMMSRETTAVNSDYIDGMHALLEEMSTIRSDVELTVSHIYWSASQDAYVLSWSHGTDVNNELDNADLPLMVDRLPILVDGESLILVQTHATYEPPIFTKAWETGVGGGVNMDTFVLTRPRFAPQLAWSNS